VSAGVLDFVVVGAQKSGTTALFEYLRRHPEIALPSGKEAPFFNLDAYYAKGLSVFVADHFPRVSAGVRRGVISPQYMTSSAITDRVAVTVPETRIVAILRDPIDRAVSHYKMAMRRKQESRSIDDAFGAMLNFSQLECARELPAAPESEAQCYLAWSEYGRILARYAEHFPRERIEILFFEDLITNPERTLDKLLEFIGLAPGYRPSNLGARVFEGSNEQRFPDLRQIAKRFMPTSIWGALPPRTRSSARYLLERFNTRPPGKRAAKVEPSAQVLTRLMDLFRDDVRDLERTFGIEVPWKRFKHGAASLDKERAAVTTTAAR
jgi:hypothetical protein